MWFFNAPPPPVTRGASFQIPDMSCFDFTLIFSSTDLDLDLEAEEDLLELCTFSAGGGAGAGAGAGASGVSGAEAPVLSGAVAGGMNGLLGGGALEVVVCGMGGGCAGAGKRGTGTCGANLVGGFNPSEKYESKLESYPRFGVKIQKYLKPPPRNWLLNQLKSTFLQSPEWSLTWKAECVACEKMKLHT